MLGRLAGGFARPEKKAGRYPYRSTPMLKASTGCRGFAKEKVPVFGADDFSQHGPHDTSPWYADPAYRINSAHHLRLSSSR